MTNMEKLRSQLQALLDKAESKDAIGELTTISNTLDDVQKDVEATQAEYKDMLKDYKEMVKHTSWKPDKDSEDMRDEKDPPKFEDFFTKSGNLPG